MSPQNAPSRRPLQDLINRQDPAWPIVQGWISQAKIDVQVLPADLQEREKELLSAQVTTRSPMGALLYETGGLLVDSGWLRILGAKSDRMHRSLSDWNKALFPHLWDQPTPPPLIVVADDVIGGLFALNGGAFGPKAGMIYYFAPEALTWEPLEMGYSEFLQWAMSENIQAFYKSTRWANWKDDVSDLAGDQGFTFYPFLFAEGPELEARQRKAAPLTEICRLHFDFMSKAQ